MITHRFPFEKTKEAFDLVAGYKDGAMKVMIDFNLANTINSYIILPINKHMKTTSL